MSEIKPDTLKYVFCDYCVDGVRSGGATGGGLSVAVTPEGHLIIMCPIHDEEPVALIHNEDVAKTLREAGQQQCSSCDHKHSKETTH